MRCAALIALTLCLALPAQAQVTRQTVREAVVDAAPYLERRSVPREGERWFVNRPATGDALWRIRLAAPDAEGPIEIRRPHDSALLDRIFPHEVGRGGWSDYLDVNRVMIGGIAADEVRITLIAWPETVMSTQTPVGATNLDAVTSSRLPLALTQSLGAIGLVRVLEGSFAGKMYYTHCTAFLVAEDRALTAAHCLANDIDDKFPELIRGYVDEAEVGGLANHGFSVVRRSEALDIALLRIDPPAPDGTGLELASGDAGPGARLIVLQHFEGAPMSVSQDDDCRTVAQPEGAADAAPPTFGHQCDTTGTSSGSPVLLRDSLQVVGLHQRGYSEGAEPVNRALGVASVRKFLEAPDHAGARPHYRRTAE